MKFVLTGLAAIVVWLFILFGTLSPCGMLREVVRKQDPIAAALPDVVLDMALAAKYGTLTQGKCVGLVLQLPSGSLAPTNTVAQQQTPQMQIATPAQPTNFQTAMQAASRAMDECRDRRLRGELKTRSDSVRCSIPRVRQIFSDANYPYMDLIEMMNAKRLEIARKQDQGQMTEEQAAAEGQKLIAELAQVERTRDQRNN